ncbi:hypothetical protein HO133_007724 [Letharia lupina]|uniref:Uncharacterized protein n=1 Tax=Letharia lupina TaxID=560253 RepID=A0A8H6CRH6_9LECA|nr:uncharacterized protein HO133_007724 [Letharia lupina]KAF6227996.1 hypothetical protein HO133_007724 [Letharia lupina]
MSFGFSIGDIIAVSHLANKVRKRLVDSSDQFKAVSDNLSNIHRDLEEVLPERELTPQQHQDRQDHIRGCENVLKDLDKIMDKYQTLDANLAGFGNKYRKLWKSSCLSLKA